MDSRTVQFAGRVQPIPWACCVLFPAPASWKGEPARHDGADGRVVGWMGGMGTGKWGKTGSLGKRNIVSLFLGGWSNMIPVD